jgi:phosphoserine phosphatase
MYREPPAAPYRTGMADDTAAPGPPVPAPRPEESSLLLRVSGPDQPGITADLMTVLELSGIEVQDLEQVLVRGHLTLAAALARPDDGGAAIRGVLEHFGLSRGLSVELDGASVPPSPRQGSDAVTVLGHGLERPLSAGELGAIAGGITAAGGNIDRIVRLARFPVYAYEFRVTGADRAALAKHLGEAAATHRLDVALQPAGLERRAKRLVVLDVDSTLIQDEVIELLAAHAGRADEVAEVVALLAEGRAAFVHGQVIAIDGGATC